MAHRRRARSRWRILLIGLALAGLTAPALAADPILARMAGDWVGRGIARKAADGTNELAYCKTTNTLADNGAGLTQAGRCAFGPDSGSFATTLTAVGNGRYEGSSSSPLIEGEAAITGSLNGNRLVLTSRGTSRQGEPVEAQTVIRVENNGRYSMVTSRLDPETGKRFNAVELVFTPDE